MILDDLRTIKTKFQKEIRNHIDESNQKSWLLKPLNIGYLVYSYIYHKILITDNT